MDKQIITKIQRVLLAPIILAMIPLVLSLFLPLNHTSAVSKTWDGGCGVDTTWSCANNWSDNIVPGSADTVTFNATSTNNSTVDSATFAGTVDTMNVNSGYTGTITLARDLTVSSTFSQAAGSFTAANQTLTLSSFSLTGGTFTASSGTTHSSTMSISGSPTFNANGGTWDFKGNLTATLSCNNVTFNLVTFTHTGGTKTVSSNCNLPLGANPTLGAGGAVVLNGTLSGSGTLTKSTGSLTLNSGSVLSGFNGLVTNGAFVVNSTLNLGSYTTVNVNNTFALNSGAVLTAPTGTASFASSFTLNSGSTFNANGGTVNFNATSSATLSCNNATFNLVTLTNTGTESISSDCTLPLGNDPTTGRLTLNGTLSGSGTLNIGGGSNTNLSSGGALVGFSGLTATNLTISGTYDFSAYTTYSLASLTVANGGNVTMPHDATINSQLILNAGSTLTASAGTMSVGTNLTFDSGATFNANGGTVNFNKSSSGTSTLSCGNKTFNLVTFTNTTGTTVVSSDCSLPLGNNPTVASTINGNVTLNGTLSGTGLLTAGGLTLGATGILSGFNGIATGGSLTVNGVYNFGSYSPFTIAGSLTLNSGAVFTAPSGTASIGGNFTSTSGGTFNANGGTVEFTTSQDGLNKIIACGNATFNLVTFTNTSSKRINSDCNLPLGNNPTIGAGAGTSFFVYGTLSGTGTLTVNRAPDFNPGGAISGFSGMVVLGSFRVESGGNLDLSSLNSLTTCTDTCSLGLTVYGGASLTAPALITIEGTDSYFENDGTFNANGGTVVFDGSSQSIVGDVTFYNLTKTVSSSDTLTFTAGNTVTVAGLLTLQGASGALLSVVSDTPGTPWLIDSQGTTNVDYVDVADSDASGGNTIVACNSIDSGGNSNWSFNPSSCNPPAPPPPDDGGGGSGTTAGIVSSTSAITNFQLLQSFLTAQSAQNAQDLRSALPFGFLSNGGLPSEIQNFLQQFPSGSGLVTAAGQFTKFMLGLLALLVWIAAFVWWWYHRSDGEEMPDEYPPILTPPRANTPPPGAPAGTPAAGTTVHPTSLSQNPKSFDVYTTPTQPATKPAKESRPWPNN